MKTRLSLKEVYLPEQPEGPALTDYRSVEELQAAMRKKVYVALKSGSAAAVTKAVREAVAQGVRFGHVQGWDKAWTQAEQEDAGRR